MVYNGKTICFVSFVSISPSLSLLYVHIVKVGVITPYPVYRNVPVAVKQIVKVPIHIPHPVPVERRVSIAHLFRVGNFNFARKLRIFRNNRRKLHILLNIQRISQVPYAIHVPIERPIPIKIIVPHPYPVEKRVSMPTSHK